MEGKTEVEVTADTLSYGDAVTVRTDYVRGDKFWMENRYVQQQVEAGNVKKVEKAAPVKESALSKSGAAPAGKAE